MSVFSSNRRVVVSAYLGRRMTWTMKEMEQRVENRFHLGAVSGKKCRRKKDGSFKIPPPPILLADP